MEGGKPEIPERGENQQQTQPTYDFKSGNRTRATSVEGKCSHHCAIPVPPPPPPHPLVFSFFLIVTLFSKIVKNVCKVVSAPVLSLSNIHVFNFAFGRLFSYYTTYARNALSDNLVFKICRRRVPPDPLNSSRLRRKFGPSPRSALVGSHQTFRSHPS